METPAAAFGYARTAAYAERSVCFDSKKYADGNVPIILMIIKKRNEADRDEKEKTVRR